MSSARVFAGMSGTGWPEPFFHDEDEGGADPDGEHDGADEDDADARGQAEARGIEACEPAPHGGRFIAHLTRLPPP